MGTAYVRNPHGDFLNEIEGNYSLDDVRRMIEYKRDEWSGTRFQNALTPKSLFDPKNLETYIAQSKMPPPTKTGREVTDDELESYGL